MGRAAPPLLVLAHKTGGNLIANRIAVLGSIVAGLGFFFLPVLEVKPNRLASGVPFNLLEIQTDYRYIALFVLSLVPLVVAFQMDRGRRGWSLVALGNLIIYLSLLLPAVAGADLLANAEAILSGETRISNPRILTSASMATGLLGGYIVLFSGILDLREEGISRVQQFLVGAVAPLLILLLITSGQLDIFSIMVEFEQRGSTLGQRLVEHLVFVIVALIAGLVIGIALGLWASRDSRIEPAILYTVGIIQTIPSLALFGVLLVPLARLGDQEFVDVFQFFIVSLLVGVVLLFLYTRIQGWLPSSLRSPLLIACVVVLFVPASIFTVVFITFGFEAILLVFDNEALSTPGILSVLGLAVVVILTWAHQQIDRERLERGVGIARIAVGALSVLGLIFTLGAASWQLVSEQDMATLTVRDLGVSGIGTAPALIALTLYSLLPLVRNTYVGLVNIDPAVIDSGRGLGMTPSQIFFQIELPLAFPVIMAGVRNAGISLVGIAAVASIIGAGALGDFILLGVNTTSIDLILLGALPAIILAIILDAMLQVLEAFLTSPGIRHT